MNFFLLHIVVLQDDRIMTTNTGISQIDTLQDPDSSVQKVELGGNRIGDVGATALAHALKVNASVQKIWINNSYDTLFRQTIYIRNTVQEMIDVLPLPTAGGHVVMYEWIAEYAF